MQGDLSSIPPQRDQAPYLVGGMLNFWIVRAGFHFAFASHDVTGDAVALP